jgi:aspartate/methionine/tyrosine aminotransferase
MSFSLNAHVTGALDPPTGETRTWLAEGARNSNLPLIDAAQAVPSYPPARELMQHLSQFVLEPESAFYAPILGIPELRRELADDLSAGYGAPLSSDQVGITSGGNHAFCMAVLAVAGAGDEVILPEPFYFNHQMWFEMQGIKVRTLPCRESAEGMVPLLEDAEKLVGPRTRLIVLVTPNNPTGTIYTPERLSNFYDFARRRGLALIIDETYKDFLPGEAPPHGLFSKPDWPDVFVHLYSFSKVYSLTGYRVGAVVAGPAMLDAVAKVADTLTICAPRVGQEAALFGLQHLDGWRAGKREELLQRIEILDAAFAAEKPPFAMVSRGAFFAYLRHPYKGLNSHAAARRVFDDLNLLTWPGSFFGADQEAYIRLAFANAAADDIAEMARRLASVTV